MKPPREPDPAREIRSPARRAARRMFRPLERFLEIEAASGIVLLAAALVALLWANSRWASSYARLWHAPLAFGVGRLAFTESVHFWVNDGLMVIFFFVVGLEIRREIHDGQLSDQKRASLPLAAALGGMAVPALLYFLVNPASPSRRGWGVPMATDIAFAVGVLALLGKRVPAPLRVLLLALAVIDDMGAILIIAFFYSAGISAGGLVIAAGGVAGVFLLQRLGVKRALVYVVPGVVIWLGVLRAGIHPTIAGVILGLLTPMRSKALVVGIETALHPWVAYVIMPLFALANAGVDVRGLRFDDPTSKMVMIGIVLGLLLGKPLGILLASFLAVRLRISVLPSGVTWRGVALAGCVAGIGFTMAIFVAGLAFPDSPVLDAAKLAVLVASACAGIIGLILGRVLLGPAAEVPVDEVAAITAE